MKVSFDQSEPKRKKVRFDNFILKSTCGADIVVLNGDYEAEVRECEQPGWYALREIDANGKVKDEIVANVHIEGTVAT